VATFATAAALVGAALAGCSSPGNDAGSKTVTFLSWDNKTTMQPLITEFQKENPGYTVKFSFAQPVTGYIQKLQTELGSGTAPDVFIITAENKQQIMDGHFAKDLSKESWISNLATAAKATYTKDGKVYGAATSSWGGGLLVNEDLLAKVGYTGQPKTWQQFLDLCKKLKDAGITPFYEAGDGIPVTLAALLGIQNQAADGKIDADIRAGKSTFVKSWTPALKTWNELFDQGLESRSVAGLTGDQVQQEFNQGKVAMIGTGSWTPGGIRQAAPNMKFEFWPVPGANGTPYWAGAVSPGYAINAKAKDPQAAEKWVEFLQSKKAAQIYNKETGTIMTTGDFTPTVDPSLAKMVAPVRKGDFYLPAVSWPTNADVLSTTSVSLMQQNILGKLTPEQFAKGMDTELQSVK
jgi:raffinose/stachyose/melibiose transport system substrate-binding protein